MVIWGSACLAEDLDIRLADGTFATLLFSTGKVICTDQLKDAIKSITSAGLGAFVGYASSHFFIKYALKISVFPCATLCLLLLLLVLLRLRVLMLFISAFAFAFASVA